ncbi:histidine phosphatase family protein [Clostridium subterminale]|uniref:Histidine phosphatase family protein n=1 Tax=Clostridium subterminale TaxID=1550 RepID=A0ABN1KQ27_CLOSU
MTDIYFVRHCEPDFSIHEELIRPLTNKGLEDSKRVAEVLMSKQIHVIYSSPYKRAIDTVKVLADTLNLEVVTKDDLRERTITDQWIDDFNSFAKYQWEDFEYKLSKGECLRQVQERNIKAIKEILDENKGKNVVVGTHGTALSTILNYYNKSFGYEEFNRIKSIMPWIIVMKFKGEDFIGFKEIDLD